VDAALVQLWENAVTVSARTGVPAPALVTAYLHLRGETAEDIAAAGQHLVDEFGPFAVLDPAAQLALADSHGMTVEQLRAVHAAAGGA